MCWASAKPSRIGNHPPPKKRGGHAGARVKKRQTAEVKLEYKEEYHGIGPVLYAKRIEKAAKPEEPMVYFN